MLQEHGLAIKRFLKVTHDTLPRSTKAKLKDLSDRDGAGKHRLAEAYGKRMPLQRHWRHRSLTRCS